MDTVSLKIGNMPQDDYNQLMQLCKTGLEKISDLAPSDNDIELTMQHQGNKFLATLKLISFDLTFNLQDLSNSPFVAVEAVLKDALDKVQKWSLIRPDAAEPAGHGYRGSA